MRRRCTLVLALSLALVAAACSDDDQQTETGDTPGSSTTAPPADGPEAADPGFAITLDVHGGYVPLEVNVGNTAEVVVLQDGRVLSGAPTTMQYPGPAFPAFQVSQADPADVQALVEAIQALDPEADYTQGADRMITDNPDTTVTLHAGADSVSVSAYALDFGDATGPRAQLREVVEQINALVTGLGDELYEPTALRVHDVTAQVGPMAAGGEGEPSGTVRDWPIPHAGAECTIVDDPAQVAAALEALGQATQLDRWRTDAGERALVVVPLLPTDPGCPDL